MILVKENPIHGVHPMKPQSWEAKYLTSPEIFSNMDKIIIEIVR